MSETRVGQIAMYLVFVSFILVIASFSWLIFVVGVNDYAIVELQNITDTEVSKGNLPAETGELLQQNGEQFQGLIYWIDDLWLYLYVSFSMGLFIMAYYTKRENIFSFFSFAYIGIMLIMIPLDVVLIAANWFIQEIILTMLPFANNVLPKLMYFVDNAGIIITAQILICALLNIVDFDFSKFKIQKDKETQSLDSQEVL